MSVPKWLHPADEVKSDAGRPSLDYLEVTFLVIFGTFIATSWVSFTLAEIGIDRPPFVLLGGVLGLAAVGVVRRRDRFGAISPVALLGLAVPVALGLILFFPPDEWILGALDPGSYITAGALIARTGHILIADRTLGAMDPAIRDVLFPFPASRLPAFYLPTLDFHGVVPAGFVDSANVVVPHGFHFFPTVLAFGYSLGGIRTELSVTPVIALGGLVAAYLLWRRLFGTAVAIIAASLLAIGPAEVWFAKYPTAEILTQLLLFGGLLAFVATIDAPRPWTAFVAGLAFGAVHLTKIETLPLPFVVAGFFIYEAIVGRFNRVWRWFLVPYGFLLCQAVAHAIFISSWYAASVFATTFSARTLIEIAVAVVVLGLASVAIIAMPGLRRSSRKLLTDRIWELPISIGGPLAIGVAAAFAYYVRPVLTSAAATMDYGQLSLVNDAQSFVRLGWYVSPIGLLLGTLGWMLLAHRGRDRRTGLLLLLLAIDTLVYLDHMHITPIHYWAARRWIPLVVPGMCLASAYILVQLYRSARTSRIQTAVLIALGLVMIAGLAKGTRPLLGYVEYRGAIDQLQALANVIPADGEVFFAEGDSGERFSTPLEYLYDRESFVVHPNPAAYTATAQLARRWLAQGKRVFWVNTAGLPVPSALGLSGAVVARQRVSLPEKIATRDTPPGADAVFQQDLEIWQLAPDAH